MTPFAWYLLALTIVAVVALVAQTIRLHLVRDELNERDAQLARLKARPLGDYSDAQLLAEAKRRRRCELRLRNAA